MYTGYRANFEGVYESISFHWTDLPEATISEKLACKALQVLQTLEPADIDDWHIFAFNQRGKTVKHTTLRISRGTNTILEFQHYFSPRILIDYPVDTDWR